MSKVGLLTTKSILFIGSLYMTTANSQVDESKGFVLGPFDVLPTLNIQTVEDDNIFQEARDTVRDTITTVAPSVSLVFDNGVSGFALNYQVDAGYYSNSTSEDYVDQTLSSRFGLTLNDTHRVEFDAGLSESHDERSLDNASQTGDEVDTENISDLDEFQLSNYRVRYIVGSTASIFNVELNAGFSERTYTTNRSFTRQNDFDSMSYGGRVSWRLSPEISLFSSVNQIEVNYTESDINSANSDSDSLNYDFGVSWEGERQLTGSIAVGNSRRDSEGANGNSENARWSVSLAWAPLSYTTFTLTASRQQDETSAQNGVQQGDFVDLQSTNLSWSHNWTDRFSTNFSVRSANEDFIGDNSDDDREDDELSYVGGVNYKFNRWLTAGLFASQTERESTDPNLDYDRALYGLNLFFAL